MNALQRLGIAVVTMAAASAIGTMLATSVTCGIGLGFGTDTWCGVGYFWLVGIPIAISVGVVFGLPIDLALSRLGLRAWWQYALCGLIIASPVWYSFAQPFSSARWEQSGAFDTLNYLGSGVFGAVAYWALCRKRPSSPS
jgi:hypothetical protein